MRTEPTRLSRRLVAAGIVAFAAAHAVFIAVVTDSLSLVLLGLLVERGLGPRVRAWLGRRAGPS
jgi:hypothetical protein